MLKIIEEGLVKLKLITEDKISKKLPVFYNPIMKLNRDISIILLNSYNLKNMRIALPLAGTGIRGIRFIKELNEEIIQELYINDLSKEAYNSINENIKLNNIEDDKRIFISNKDANLFLLESQGFDYIDIDPFGSPNQFIDSAILRLSRNSILAITATDTAPLCGTYPNTCKRKYWSNPLHNELMHEIGLRILIKKVQLIAAQYDRALTPIFCYSYDHYMRIFFKCEKGKKKVDEIIKQHKTFNYEDFEIKLKGKYGPIWTGNLFDKNLIENMKKKSNNNLINMISNEEDLLGFYDLHKIAEKYKLPIPKMDYMINELKLKKFKASRTHFSEYGIKSNADIKEIKKIMLSNSSSNINNFK